MTENNPMPQKEGKKFPKWAWWVIGIIGAVILVGVGWWVASSKYKAENQKLKNQLSSSTTTSATSSSTTSTTSSAVDPTAGWKTYTNDKYGFVMKHPSDWKAEERSGANVVDLQSPTAINEQKAMESEQREGCESGIHVRYFKNILAIDKYYNMENSDVYQTTLSQWLESGIDPISNKKVFSDIKTIDINGKEGVEATLDCGTNLCCSPDHIVLIENNRQIFEIDQATGDQEKSQSATDKLVIGSFKFTK